MNMNRHHPDRERLQQIYDLAITLRTDADPLLAGQYEGIIGRLTALLAITGAPIPDDALPEAET